MFIFFFGCVWSIVAFVVGLMEADLPHYHDEPLDSRIASFFKLNPMYGFGFWCGSVPKREGEGKEEDK
jgi:hypothetical protein